MKAMISFIVTFPLLSVAIATSPYPHSTASDLEPVHFRLKSESAARILDICIFLSNNCNCLLRSLVSTKN